MELYFLHQNRVIWYVLVAFPVEECLLVATVKGDSDLASSKYLAELCELTKVHAQDYNRLWLRVGSLTGFDEKVYDHSFNELTAEGVARGASSSEPGLGQFRSHKR